MPLSSLQTKMLGMPISRAPSAYSGFRSILVSVSSLDRIGSSSFGIESRVESTQSRGFSGFCPGVFFVNFLKKNLIEPVLKSVLWRRSSSLGCVCCAIKRWILCFNVVTRPAKKMPILLPIRSLLLTSPRKISWFTRFPNKLILLQGSKLFKATSNLEIS